MVWRVFHHTIYMAREVSRGDAVRFALCGKIIPDIPIISQKYPSIKKAEKNIAEDGLKSSAYHFRFHTHPQTQKKVQKSPKKDLTIP